jgi:hypothetical protein
MKIKEKRLRLRPPHLLQRNSDFLPAQSKFNAGSALTFGHCNTATGSSAPSGTSSTAEIAGGTSTASSAGGKYPKGPAWFGYNDDGKQRSPFDKATTLIPGKISKGGVNKMICQEFS